MHSLALPLAAATALELAARDIGRLDLALSGHVLQKAFAYRVRLEAVRRQAFADGFVIDPWQVAALRLDLRLCLSAGDGIAGRAALLAAARQALDLDAWLTAPAAAQPVEGEVTGKATAQQDNSPPALYVGHVAYPRRRLRSACCFKASVARASLSYGSATMRPCAPMRPIPS